MLFFVVFTRVLTFEAQHRRRGISAGVAPQAGESRRE